MYFSADDDYFKYIYLDTSPNELSKTQCKWLEEALITDKKVIIFIHHPVLQVDMAIDRKYPLLNRDIVLQILKNSKKDITIFSGHYHTSDKTKSESVTQYVTPAASVQYEKDADNVLPDSSNFGYRLIDLDEDTIRTRLVLNRFGEGFEICDDF